MKIALLDFYTKGHHLHYVSDIAEHLIKKGHQVMFITIEKDEHVVDLLKKYPEIALGCIKKDSKSKDLNSVLPNPKSGIFKKIVLQFKKIQFLKPVVDMGKIYIKCRNQKRLFESAFSIAKEWEADVLHLLYLDGSSMFPLYLITTKLWPFKIFGTFFWLEIFLNNNLKKRKLSNLFSPDLDSETYEGGRKFFFGAVFERIKAIINNHFLKSMVCRGSFSGLFIHNVYPKKTKDLLVSQFDWIRNQQNRIVFLFDPIYKNYGDNCDRIEARKKLGLPLESSIFLFFGELTWGKGLDILLEALKRVQEEICLVIAGRPIYFFKKDIDGYIKEIKNPRVKVVQRLGFIENKDAPYYFSAADAVVMPYRKKYSIGTSGILTESIAASKPVICSDVGTIGPLVKEKLFGLAIKAESPESLVKGITELLSQKTKIQQECLKSSMEYLRIADWQEIFNQIYNLYTNKNN